MAYIPNKKLETVKVSVLIEEIIHLRRLLQNSRNKTNIWVKKANKLTRKIELLTNAPETPTAIIIPDHHLVNTIRSTEDFLIKQCRSMEESQFRQVMGRMFEMTDELLAFKRESEPVNELN